MSSSTTDKSKVKTLSRILMWSSAGVILLLGVSANRVKADPPVTLQQVNPAFPIDQMAGQNVITKHRVTPNPKGSLPTVQQRDRAFAKAGIKLEIEKWDQLDRDKLYMDTRASTEATPLTKNYPTVPKEKLDLLWKIIHSGSPS